MLLSQARKLELTQRPYSTVRSLLYTVLGYIGEKEWIPPQYMPTIGLNVMALEATEAAYMCSAYNKARQLKRDREWRARMCVHLSRGWESFRNVRLTR